MWASSGGQYLLGQRQVESRAVAHLAFATSEQSTGRAQT